VAVESAGIVLVRNDARDVVGVIQLSRTTYRKMIENLAWATGYNVVAIPIAAGLLVPWGIDLPMSVGAIAMSASTIIVAANAPPAPSAPDTAARLADGEPSCDAKGGEHR
jgi:Cu2+-exporting ATPase